ncbi:hypothetical protein MEA186_35939 [Mesorhizobium amorphae CCNWGS0123]|uniref:Uncharacterized protein n=1 Tax=Mesorhizobium amorphae CCNWGS0123 TaxID=1082933 RepID=G6YMD2_9HYPH|nr:hypothetical protein A6B35_31215 [Mesorhizobium amorphae CCNWGS0123]EHH02140.1 hypothetical protein MEA186_35939 [Mesorhizobium amorphae CCNWGS0123]
MPRQVTGECFDPTPHLSAQLLLVAGAEPRQFVLCRGQFRQPCIPLRLEAGRDHRLAGSTSTKRRRARSLS